MFENFTRILGISLELQAFAIIGDIKKLLYMDQIQARSEDFKRGGGARFRILLCPTQRGPNGQDYAGIGSRAGVQWEIFHGGHKQGPKGRSICAEARRAKAAGDGVQEKGCPLPLSKKIFYY